MYKIDRNLLTGETLKLGDFVIQNQCNKSVIKEHLPELISLNSLLASLAGVSIDIEPLFWCKDEVKRIYKSNQEKSQMDFWAYIYDNAGVIEEMYNNHSVFLDSLDFEYYPMQYSFFKGYSKKDITDIILSYFSTFDNKTYNKVKTYFDENRIEMDFDEAINFDGVFYSSKFLNTGYIVCRENKFNSLTASIIVHELGHMLDYTTFIYPQQKRGSVVKDALLEVPSSFYATDFSNYLIDKKIDPLGGRLLLLQDYVLIEDPKNIDMSDDADVFEEFRSKIIYSIGSAFALNLVSLRKEDPKTFKKKLNDLLTSRKESYLIEDSLDKIGISVSEFVNGERINDDIKENVKELKKKFKY